MYENKFPTGYLENQKTTVTQSGDTYIVDYGVGECVYTYRKVGKRIKQEVLQLIKCDMWKVITLINEDNKLTEGDYQQLNMEIRNHSLNKVTEFISGEGRHQQ
jgi:phospholipid N-methyltransferase